MTNTTQDTTSSGELKQKLEARLDDARQRIDDAKQDLASLHAEDKENIRKKADEIRGKLDQQQQKVQELRTQASSWIREKKEETEATIASWRQRREIKRLLNRADRAEEFAINAVAVAVADLQEAEVAMLEALDARLDAEAIAAGSAT